MPTQWKSMGLAQRIATVALAALALIALIAFGAHKTSGSTSTSPSSSSTFSPSSSSSSHASSSKHSTTSTNPVSPSPSDGLGSIPLATLSAQAQHTVELIDAGGPFPYSRDGIVYQNRDRSLPVHAKGWYHEYTVTTPGASSRGTRRVIEGKDGTLYYTGDHYKTFDRILR